MLRNKILGMAVAGTMALVAGTASAVQMELRYAADGSGAPTDAQIRNMPVGGFGPVDHSILNDFLNAGGGTSFDVGGHATDVDAMVFKNNKQDGSGLWVTDLDRIASIDVRFTYMGSEAAFKNFSVGGNSTDMNDNVVFDNKSGLASGQVAETISFDVSGVTELWLPFLFETVFRTGGDLGTGARAVNNGTIDSTMQMAFMMQENGDLFTNALDVVNGSTIAMFGDGTGDSDLDDLIIGIGVVGVTAVPVPAALPLLLTGLAGLGLLGRRKSKLA